MDEELKPGFIPVKTHMALVKKYENLNAGSSDRIGQLLSENDQLRAQLAEREARVKHLEDACIKSNEDICQTLGKVLGYPWFKDDQKNFPGATEENGVCVGEHVAESIAMEAARVIAEREKTIERLKEGLTEIMYGGLDCPAAMCGSEASFYRSRAYDFVGIAARTLEACTMIEENADDTNA